MGLFVFFVLVLIVRSESLESDGFHTVSESSDYAMCVCRPDITINPPVNSGIGCNSSAIQEIVSMEQKVTTRQLEELQNEISSNQESVSSELEDDRRKMDELQVTVSVNQENVTTEVLGIRQQIEELQASVSAILDTSSSAVIFKDCSDALTKGVTKSGVYTVTPSDSGEPFQVYCDMETEGGGWTVFQRRKDGSVDFHLDFASYSRGFGNLEGEFWLGNDNLHRLTAQGEYELRVDLTDFRGKSGYALYDLFSIASVSDNYRLTLGSYSGTAGDSLSISENKAFTTKDKDNDAATSKNCAVTRQGAWWYNDCGKSNLNGFYFKSDTQSVKGISWYTWKIGYTFKYTNMKLRVKS